MSKTVLSIKQPTPTWATWLFRIEFFLNKAFLLWLGGTNHITPNNIQEILLVATCIDVFVWGMGRGLGVKKEDFEIENQTPQ